MGEHSLEMSISTYTHIARYRRGLGLAERISFPQRVANQGSNLGWSSTSTLSKISSSGVNLWETKELSYYYVL